MYKVIIWGTGSGYSQHFNTIKNLEKTGEIEVVGVFSNDIEYESRLDNFKFYKKNQISNLDFDYCLVTIFDMKSIFDEAESLGIPRKKLIPARVFDIPYFNLKKYIKLKEEGISIFSRMCWAGYCYNYLALEFQSPTINLFFSSADFVTFMSNLDYYLTKDIKFSKMCYEVNLKHYYPVGQIDDIFVYFNHYTNFDEAVEKWERRKKRITKNIAVVSYTESKQDAIEFSKLPYNSKLMFIPKESGIENGYNNCLYTLNHKDCETNPLGIYCNNSANGIHNWINLFSFLVGSRDFWRKS